MNSLCMNKSSSHDTLDGRCLSDCVVRSRLITLNCLHATLVAKLLFILLTVCSLRVDAQQMHWKVVATLGDTVDLTVGGLSCVGGEQCFASAVWRGNLQSNFYRSTDAGRTWSRLWSIDANDSIQSRPPTVLSIAALSRETVVVGSDSGRVLVSHDSGRTFLVRQLFWAGYLPSTDAADERNAIVGPWKSKAVIYVTGDAGHSWDTLELPREVYDDMLQDVMMPTPNVILCLMNTVGVGHPLVRSDDRGKTWQVFRGLPRGSFHMDFVDSLYGWVTGAGTAGSRNNDTSFIAATTDGGRTWTTQWRERLPNALSLVDVSFADRLNGTVVGGGHYILHTTNGGKTWAMVTNDIPHDLPRSLHVSSTTAGGNVVATQKGVILLPSNSSDIPPDYSTSYTLPTVFPNPVSRFDDARVTISVRSRGCVSVSMVASNGDVVWSDACRILDIGTHLLSIDVGDVKPGPYFIRFRTGDDVTDVGLVVR